MATFNTSFFEAGKGSAVKLPELDAMERSSRRNSELAIKGQEMKLKKSLQDKATFEKMLAIDPITAISTKNATDQAIALEGYNNKWGKRYVDAKGELSFADQIEMQKDRSLLQAKQKKVLATQQQYLAAKQTIARDTRGYYDRSAFEKAEQEYFNTGELSPNALDIAPQDIVNYLAKLSPTEEWGEDKQETITDDKGNIVGKNNVTYKYKATKEQAQRSILNAMQNEAILKGVVLDFDSLSEDEQLKWVGDYNKDGVVDPNDNLYAHDSAKIKDNPIVQWAMNNEDYLSPAMGKERMTPKNPQSTKSSSAYGGWSTYYGAGKKTTYEPKEARDVGVIGQTPYSSYHDIPNIPVDDVTVKAIRVLNPKGEETIQPKSPISAELVGYDSGKDELIFVATKDFINIGGQFAYPKPYGSGMRFAVKRSDTGDKYKDVDILQNGKKVKIGQVTQSAPATAPTTEQSNPNWDKYKRK